MFVLVDTRRLRSVVALVAAMAAAHVPATAGAQATPRGLPPGAVDLAEAITRTRTEGTPTVVVVTSAREPGSRDYWLTMAGSAWAAAHEGRIQLVELPAEANPELVETLRIRATPAVFAYVRGDEGLSCRGSRTGGSPQEAILWLDSLGLAGDRDRAGDADADPAVVRAGFHHHQGYPSAQQPPTPQAPPPAPSVPAVPTMAPAVPMAMPTTTMMMMAPQMAAPAAAAPTAVFQMPGPNLVVQQGQPQVFMTQAAPAMSMPMMAQPSAAFGNLFVPSAAPAAAMPMAAAPAAAPAAMAMAAVPVAAPAATVAAPVAAVPAAAPAAPSAMAAVTNQTLALPMASSRTSVRFRGNGLLRSGLVNLGRYLTGLDRAQIVTEHVSELNTPMAQGGGGIATFSTTSAAPVSAPQVVPVVAPQAAPPQEQYVAPPPTVPSPQGAPHHHKHGHLFGHHHD